MYFTASDQDFPNLEGQVPIFVSPRNMVAHQDFPNLEGQVPIFVSPRNMVAHMYPKELVSISSPPTTLRAIVVHWLI
jgi:hypothetical protein